MTRSNSRTRRSVAMALAIATTTALVGLGTTPASASSVDSDTLVFVPYNGQTFSMVRNGILHQKAYFTTAQSFPGDFDGQPGTDLFLYNPGSAPDGILHVTPNVADFSYSFRSTPIAGTYTPVVGDFDGNAIDDVLWYAPGTAADSIWLFKADGSHTTKAITVNGTYKPTAINVDGDGTSDLIWYAPGTAGDSIWRFDGSGNHTTKSITVNGSYTLIPGYFGLAAEGSPQRRLMFFNKAGADSIWTFDTSANHTSAPLPNVDGNGFKPIVGNFTDTDTDAVLFYRPGTLSERFLSFTDGGLANDLEPPTVNGSYDPTVGDFDGNGFGDIAWTAGGKATIWKFTSGGYTQSSVTTDTTNTIGRTIANYLFAA